MATRKSVLITGCSDGGLGSHLALALKQLGWRVFASARNLSKLSVVKEANIECIQLDVCSESSVANAAKEVEKLTGGSLDVLINMAGGGYSMPIIYADLDEARRLFELNVMSPIIVIKAFFPLLRASQRDPILMNVSSGSGFLGCGTPFQGLYAASKGALNAVSESLRQEIGPFGIRVVTLVAGGVHTHFHDNAKKPHLPDNSVYDVAKEELEDIMDGNVPGMNRQDPKVWAANVAKDLSQKKVPHMLYRGTNATVARFASLAPTGLLDSTTKSMGGVDIFEKKLKEQDKLHKTK